MRTETLTRVIGNVCGERPGPLVVAVAGVHGNEPAGVAAAREVLDGLDPARTRGRVLALAGNLGALATGQRFLERDMNRGWRPDSVARLRRDGPSPGIPEDREQLALLECLDAAFRTGSEIHLVDLHTTSGPGPAFTTFGDTLANRAFARALPLPMVLGLEELVAGTLLEYMDSLGHTAIAVEGGQHDDPAAATQLADALRLCLAAAAAVDPDEDALGPARRRLAALSRRLPAVVEMRYRHPVAPRDDFRMRPGYVSFAEVHSGEAVALSAAGEVRIPEPGRILMPRYQDQGDDGYFLVREVSAAWLTVSAVLRRLRLDRLAPFLPGVRRHPRLPAGLVVDLRVVRWYGLEVFHLLGFRRRRRVGSVLVLVRRRRGS